MIERSQGYEPTPVPEAPGSLPAAATGAEVHQAAVQAPAAAQGPDPRTLLVFEPAGMFGGPEAMERTLKTDQFSSLAEKLEQATIRHAKAVAAAITDALRGNADMMIGGRFQLVERPDEFDGIKFRFDGLRLSFPYSQAPEVTWDLTITSTHDLRDWCVEASDEKERLLEKLEEWRGEDVRPVEVGKDVATWASELQDRREMVLRRRRFPEF